VLDVIDRGTPRMDLDHVHVEQAKKAVQVIDPDTDAFAPSRFCSLS
jgi:hypothetical protein